MIHIHLPILLSLEIKINNWEEVMKRGLLILSLLLVVVGLAGCLDVNPKNYKIEISASTLEAEAGDTVELSYQVTPPALDKVVTWAIVQGEEIAEIEGNTLTISEEAEPNAEIQIKATLEKSESNTLKIKVIKLVESVTISASSNLVEPGETVDLTAVVTPEDATNINVQWVIVEGNEFASVDTSKNQLFVRASAAPGSVVKVKAVNGDVESDTLTITVYDPKQDELYLLMPYDDIEIDINAAAKTLEAQVFNDKFEKVLDQEIIFTVLSGADVLGISANGYQCTLTALGHGQAVVRAQIKGTGIYVDTTVDVIVPPIALRLPEVFVERPNYVYSVGKSFELPFVPTPVKGEGVTKVSEDLVYTFTKKGSTATSNEIAVVENGKVKFQTTGEITVKVSSNSGSRIEATTQYTFNVNNGVTVTNYEELKAAIEKHGRIVSEELNENLINVVVLEKVINENRYGYDLVPAHIVENYVDKSLQDILKVQRTQIYGNGSYEIIGNNHRINLEDQRVLTKEDYDWYYDQTGEDRSNVDDLLQFRAYTGEKELKVFIRDLKVKGNSGIDFPQFSGENPRAIGVHRYAIFLNKPNELGEKVALETKIENVAVTNFAGGIEVRYAYNGLFTKVTIDNIFATGLAIMASKVELNDMTFGPCGASAFEFQGRNNDSAPTSKGPDAQFTDQQQGRITGYFNTSNYNDGRTNYLSNYQKTLLQGNTIVDIIALNLADNAAAMDNVYNQKGEVLFAGLIFMDFDDETQTIIPNTTELALAWEKINYKDMQANDTTHKYVELELKVPLFGDLITVGRVLLVNLNYVGE